MSLARHRDGPVTTLTLDRPDKRNAITAAMITELNTALDVAETDPDYRVLVLTEAGGHFATGRDLGDANAATPLAEVMAYDATYTAIFEKLRRSAKPSVAMVRGFAVAGGFTLAMGCDFVLAERDAKFGALEMRGGFPAAVSTAILSHLVGPRQALELLLSADTFTAEHLYQVGLINKLADGDAGLDAVAAEFIAGLAALDPIAVRLTKETQNAAMAMPLVDALVLAKQLNSLMMTSGKIDEAAAHFEKSRN